VLLWTLSEIEGAVRASWCRETCDPVETHWSAENPARGQCAVTALVLHDLLGGEVLIADAWNADGSRQGFHYWNRLAGGVELDLTRVQFLDGETLSEPEIAPIPQDRTNARLARQYQRLSAAVHQRLVDGADETDDASRRPG
jgi:hypothetical protein